MSGPGHEWTPHEREGWSVCSRCGMVRNYDRETTTCSRATNANSVAVAADRLRAELRKTVSLQGPPSHLDYPVTQSEFCDLLMAGDPREFDDRGPTRRLVVYHSINTILGCLRKDGERVPGSWGVRR